LRESKAVCETAQTNLAEYQRIVKAPAFRPELYTFAAYPAEFAALQRDYYLRYLFGPFLLKAECERYAKLFQSAAVDTQACGQWAYN